jgi:hypothetical protein
MHSWAVREGGSWAVLGGRFLSDARVVSSLREGWARLASFHKREHIFASYLASTNDDPATHGPCKTLGARHALSMVAIS